MRATIISFLSAAFIAAFFPGCSKTADPNPSPAPLPPANNDFIKYTIRQGQQYCDQSAFVNVAYAELKFTVKFDNTAKYQTTDPANQEDINKLFGFSDNNKRTRSTAQDLDGIGAGTLLGYMLIYIIMRFRKNWEQLLLMNNIVAQ